MYVCFKIQTKQEKTHSVFFAMSSSANYDPARSQRFELLFSMERKQFFQTTFTQKFIDEKYCIVTIWLGRNKFSTIEVIIN